MREDTNLDGSCHCHHLLLTSTKNLDLCLLWGQRGRGGQHLRGPEAAGVTDLADLSQIWDSVSECIRRCIRGVSVGWCVYMY